MTREQLLILDAARDESLAKINLGASILSNQKAFWNGVKVSYHKCLKPFETPKHYFSQHPIIIYLNHTAVLKEQLLNGHLQGDRFFNGDICLTPANTPVLVRLQDSIEFISLHHQTDFDFFKGVKSDILRSLLQKKSVFVE